MPITSGFNHIATLTPDLDRFVDWYGKVFGAEVVLEIERRDDHPRMIILDMGGGSALNVFEVPPDAIIGERRSIGARGAIDHFGIAVPDLETLEAVKERLVANDADIGEIQELGGDTWSLFFRDCDGMELEVCAPLT
jgi:catechol 2,3-dioxygenase-like lactoylglutathione lyase family enzyme